ncbi:NAD(P)-dependent oxidoreductase [Pseudonocardia alaniniphila]|uniref:NAD(P)-binding domain-containing protein n=1 Tax=Pseudonocardia alaniniphila TaxID=75291 RepID=A0ABS9TL61_9PSEU|nr:NAD(P)-binding domain-containing protein [Pseudonocardia alaniniphila]MCH6169284.1 NAD(P)-binding domain-containing protein [Pseudonocardia alaniniphila]
MKNTDKAVTVLGLGAMGGALARAFVAAGHPTTVWNRAPEKAAALVAAGAVRAETATAAVAASPLVVVCLGDHRSVHEVLDPVGDALAGRVLVNLTTGTPEQARELDAWASERGAEHLDGGIMAVPPMIGTPAAFVLYSGPLRTFDAHRATLDVLGDSRFVGEDPGLASLHDLALLSGMYGMFEGALQAFALVRSAGGSAKDFAPALREWLRNMSEFVTGSAEQIDTRDYATDVVATLAMQASSYGHLVDVAEAQGVSTELITPLAALMDRRVADGHGQDGIASVIEALVEPRAATGVTGGNR